MKNKSRLYLWLPPIIWMAVIFIFSSFSSLKVETFVPDFYLRKGAHLFEYATLSLLYYQAINKGSKGWSFYSSLLALVFSILYGASDEFHQSFVPQRTASPVDVLIDSSGALLAQFVLLLVRGKWR